MPKSKAVEVLITLDHLKKQDAHITDLKAEVKRLEDLLDKRMEDSQAVVAHLRTVRREQAEVIRTGRAMQAELLKTLEKEGGFNV